MDKKTPHFSKYDKLNSIDTDEKTYGCRCYNPDICKHNGDKTCAFYNDEHICYTPPKGWKKTFYSLKEDENTEYDSTNEIKNNN